VSLTVSTPPHPPFERLADLAEGRLPADQAAALQAHLATCAACTSDLAWLRRVAAVMRSDVSQAAPEHVVNRALRLFPQRQAAGAAAAASGSPLAGLRERLVAALRFDSGAVPLALGLRAGGGPGGQERQLLYSAGAYEVEVRLTPGDGGWVVAGQVLGPDADGAGTATLDGPPGRVEAPLSPLSEFAFPAQPAGSYRLLLGLAGVEVAIDGLLVPADGPAGPGPG
jgi:hypothetical protein